MPSEQQAVDTKPFIPYSQDAGTLARFKPGLEMHFVLAGTVARPTTTCKTPGSVGSAIYPPPAGRADQEEG